MKRWLAIILLVPLVLLAGCDGTLRLCNSSNEDIEYRIADFEIDAEERSVDVAPGQEAVIPVEVLPDETSRLLIVSAYDVEGTYLGACSILLDADSFFSDVLKADWDGETLNCTLSDTEEGQGETDAPSA